MNPIQEAAPATRQRHGRVGDQVSRVDGPLKVRGAARFAAEVPLRGLTYAALVPSTIARGRIVAIDTAAAAAAPGVALVMTHENAPRMKAPLTLTKHRDKGGRPWSNAR